MTKTEEYTSDIEGRLVRVVTVEYSIEEKAASAGKVRAMFERPMLSDRTKLAKCLRGKTADISHSVWEAYKAAYLLESTGAPF